MKHEQENERAGRRARQDKVSEYGRARGLDATGMRQTGWTAHTTWTGPGRRTATLIKPSTVRTNSLHFGEEPRKLEVRRLPANDGQTPQDGRSLRQMGCY